MMTAICGPDPVIWELKKLFRLPDNLIWMELRLAVDEAVTVRCEYFADRGTGETITQTFNLVPAEEEPEAVEPPADYARVPLRG